MIHDAEEFIRLRTSGDPSEYRRASTDDAPFEVWQEIVGRHAEMRSWVAHNKTVPVEILAILAHDPSPEVRHTVAMKNKLPSELMLLLADDEDETIRRRIAHNKNAPIEALRKLAADGVEEVAKIAAERLAALAPD